MSDRYHGDRPDRYDAPPREVAINRGRLPGWLARRLLRADEEIQSVRGPRHCPSWEPFLTHPGVVVVGLALAVAIIAVGGLALGSFGDPLMAVPCVLAFLSMVGGLVVVGITAGYFTRLVITNQRVMIVQGYEIRKTWRLEDLPRSLVRMSRTDDGELKRTVDMDTLQTMMGGSDQFAEAKTIWALGKEIDRIKREDRR
jgi:hypothetical protein